MIAGSRVDFAFVFCHSRVHSSWSGIQQNMFPQSVEPGMARPVCLATTSHKPPIFQSHRERRFSNQHVQNLWQVVEISGALVLEQTVSCQQEVENWVIFPLFAVMYFWLSKVNTKIKVFGASDGSSLALFFLRINEQRRVKYSALSFERLEIRLFWWRAGE